MTKIEGGFTRTFIPSEAPGLMFDLDCDRDDLFTFNPVGSNNVGKADEAYNGRTFWCYPSYRHPLWIEDYLNGRGVFFYNNDGHSYDFSTLYSPGTEQLLAFLIETWGAAETNPGYTAAFVFYSVPQTEQRTMLHFGAGGPDPEVEGPEPEGRRVAFCLRGSDEADAYPAFEFGNGRKIFTKATLEEDWHIGIFTHAQGGTYADCRLWVDGVEWTESIVENPTAVPAIDFSTDCYITVGASFYGWDTWKPFQSYLARALFYDSALSEARIAQLNYYLSRRYGLALGTRS